ncbi:lymphocyte antigen 75-like [Dicentrarchus labrax]|uniref:lymphocyte antigen 75-like n=1 Tax=Dicentrarchus labrax TaxID=13489 RepID=UPI0021F573EB|nr:lymphocyte antigen 75-like [Dicentrarchus labrax]XP_051259610.1 lymphocyte antigen 75-like [Dicentrarchus labrax]
MKETAAIMIVLSGLCLLASCFPRLYILVEKPSTWDKAQSYCREKYTDLASVHNERDLAKLNTLIENNSSVWIGLKPVTKAWTWSLQNQSYYGDGEADFRVWAVGEPSAPQYYTLCVSMGGDGHWKDELCEAKFTFLCCNKSAENTSSSFIFVNESKTWKAAQSYCRQHYTDLASVRNQSENDLMKDKVPSGHQMWIGLYRDTWSWSDGSVHSFTNWAPSSPSISTEHSCAFSKLGKWYNLNCSIELNFVCYTAPAMKRQVVKVVLKKKHGPSVDMDKLKEDILEGFNKRLKDRGLNEDVELRWVKQPDGKIFHKEEKEKMEEKSCDRDTNKLLK